MVRNNSDLLKAFFSPLSQYTLVSSQYPALPHLLDLLVTLNSVGRRTCPVRWHRSHGTLFRDYNECLQTIGEPLGRPPVCKSTTKETVNLHLSRLCRGHRQ